MPSTLRRFGLFLALVLLAASVPAHAQWKKQKVDLTRDVQGIVTDGQGKTVEGAVVQLKNMRTLEIISYITKEQGDYYFHGLSPEIDFEVTAMKGDQMSATRTLSTFDTRKQSVLNLKLDKKRPGA